MESLMHISPTVAGLWCGVLIVITGCLIFLFKTLAYLIKRAADAHVTVKAGPVALSPKDSVSMPVVKEDTEKVDTDDWSRHQYFLELHTIKTQGVKAICSSPIKSQFINEYLKIYAGVLYDELLPWVETVAKNNGKGIADITQVMVEIETKCLNKLLDTKINIRYRDKVIMVSIPKFLVDRFLMQYGVSQSTCFETLKMPIDSVFYPDWRVQLVSILSQLYTILYNNFVGINCAVKSLNGELDEYLEKYIVKYYKHIIVADYILDN